ncbi:MAG: ProQ/FINO family protein [Saccharospirillum sp.]
MTEESIAVPEKAPAPRKSEAQRKKELEANRKALDELCEHFPEVFNPRQPKPLKIGIHEDIAATGKLSKTRVRRALNVYVRLRSYYRCMVEGADRVGLDGQASGLVSAEEASHAKDKLDAIDKRRAERQKHRPEARKRSDQNARGKGKASPGGAHRNRSKQSQARTRAEPEPAQAESPKSSEERLQQKLQALVNKPSNR